MAAAVLPLEAYIRQPERSVVGSPNRPQPVLRLIKKTPAQPVRKLEAPWTTSDCLALAQVTCNRCFGTGSHPAAMSGRLKVCHCVLRAVFRTCYAKWREIADNQFQTGLSSLQGASLGGRRSGRGGWQWSRPREEYRADFELIARRTLDIFHYEVFRMHFLEGFDWKACCARLRTDRGNFFHCVYRVEERLGRAYREVAPFGLFPLGDYFVKVA